MNFFRGHATRRSTLASLALLAALTGSAGAWSLPTGVQGVLLAVINQFSPTWRVEVETLAQLSAEEWEAGGVRLVRREDGAELLALRRVKVRATFSELRDHRVRELALDGPRVQIGDALLQALQPAPSTAPPTPWTVERLTIADGSATVDLATAPPARFDFEARLSNLVTSGPPSASLEPQTITVRNLDLRARGGLPEPFLHIPSITAGFVWRELIADRTITSIRIDGPDFRCDRQVIATLAGGASPPAASVPPATKAAPYRVGDLQLVGGKVRLDDLGLGLPTIAFGVQTAFHDLALSLAGEALGDTLQTLELHDIALQSPFDPFVSVLTLKTIFVRFTPAGLWRREIAQVEIIHPILNVGEDLFWYVDRAQRREPGSGPAAAPPEPAEAWTIQSFDATAGELTLAFEGHPRLPLPLPFASHATGLNFRKLSELRLTLDLTVPEQDYRYPAYGLTLRGVAGRLKFSLPPEHQANNLVHSLTVAEVQWKDYAARNLFLDVTFDKNAIHGDLGGKAYAGYLRGSFDFALDAASTWTGWIAGSGIDAGKFSRIVAPEKFTLTGPLDFRAEVAAQARDIQHFKGDFKATRRGELHLGKLDEIIKALPPDWAAVKRGLTRIGLEALRDFTYQDLHGDFHFLGRAGELQFQMRGADGSRNFHATFHDASAETPAAPRQLSRR